MFVMSEPLAQKQSWARCTEIRFNTHAEKDSNSDYKQFKPQKAKQQDLHCTHTHMQRCSLLPSKLAAF